MSTSALFALQTRDFPLSQITTDDSPGSRFSWDVDTVMADFSPNRLWPKTDFGPKPNLANIDVGWCVVPDFLGDLGWF